VLNNPFSPPRPRTLAVQHPQYPGPVPPWAVAGHVEENPVEMWLWQALLWHPHQGQREGGSSPGPMGAGGAQGRCEGWREDHDQAYVSKRGRRFKN